MLADERVVDPGLGCEYRLHRRDSSQLLIIIVRYGISQASSAHCPKRSRRMVTSRSQSSQFPVLNSPLVDQRHVRQAKQYRHSALQHRISPGFPTLQESRLTLGM